jgi:folate-binding protein YgfZ
MILRISGADTRDFLQGLITNDVAGLDTGMVYAAILTPQGKYLADFFLVADGAEVLLDVDTALAGALVQRLNMYKLRADVAIEETALRLHRGLGAAPADGHADPRHEALGWRAYRTDTPAPDATDWNALYVQHLIPQTGVELTPDTFILEVGFERLNGVDFRKGCYVGQEVTARMKHKTELRKGLARVRLSTPVPEARTIERGGKAVGELLSRDGVNGIAYLRFDRVGDGMTVGAAVVEVV